MDAEGVDRFSFAVTVRGTVDADVRASILAKWPGAHGGLNPVTEVPYMTAPCPLEHVDERLQWITEAFPGDYTALEILLVASTKLGWGTLKIPDLVTASAQRHGAAIHVHFHCDPIHKGA
jgi:hypothetical protein